MTHREQNVIPTGWCPDEEKLAYGNRKQARAARRRMAAGGSLNIYRCDDCGFLHLGHMPAVVRNGEVDKETWQSHVAARRTKENR